MTVLRFVVRAGAIGAVVAPTASAWGCMLCHSDTAERVRASVLGTDFWFYAGALSAPVPVLIAAVLLVRRLSS